MADGTKDFKRDLQKLDKKVRNKVIKAAQKNAMKPLAAEIKGSAPVETGSLKSSIKVKTGKRKKDTISTIVNISTDDELAYAARSEFGTRNQPAAPFIRPAAKRMKPGIIQAMMDWIDRAIKSL